MDDDDRKGIVKEVKNKEIGRGKDCNWFWIGDGVQ